MDSPNNTAQIDNGLNSMGGAGGTALYNAIYLGSTGLRQEKEGRKVLVAGCRTAATQLNGYSYNDAKEQALRNEVMIYSIIDVPIEASAGPRPRRLKSTPLITLSRADRRPILLCPPRFGGLGERPSSA